jgi:hypothetical protein
MGMDKQMDKQMDKKYYSIFRDKLSLPDGSLDCHQRMPEALDIILATLGYVTQEAKAFALQRNTSVTKGF